MPTDKKRCLDAGMDDYLSKPFNLKDIKGCLERCSKKSGTRFEQRV